MESLFSHPYQPEAIPSSSSSAESDSEVQSPIFSDRPTQDSNADRPPRS
jgi:hypothetical protein